ncbi:carbohydrate ABC transporter substrate-binding protein, partial [Agromyces binzhouensis]|uniref:carbohydrate ABC transporter substrate-binding protein n=1 Tax=Agromyces binzhouensis TaxID=1817495 RepID=UPI0013EB949E
ELVPVAPTTWDEVRQLATTAPVALSLAGPHAFLSFASICVALGAAGGADATAVVPATEPGCGFVDREIGERAFALMAELAAGMPEGAPDLNPIGLIERMRRVRDIAYVPLVYGYVNYASGPGALRFDDAPAATSGSRRGSTIGGTGIAISRRCRPDADLVAHLAGLLDPEVQRTFIPEYAGQPGLRSAWTDDTVNAASGDFYRTTLATIEDAWVRPRVPGYIPFQSAASALLREALLGRGSPADALNELDRAFDTLARERSVL